MGYRSDVKIVTSKNGFNELKKYVVQEALKFKKPDRDYSENLLEYADNIKMSDSQVVISWSGVKWYTNYYDDVDIIMHGLDHLEASGYSYRFYEIGEDYTDITETCVDGDLDGELDYLYIVRYIDDEIIHGKDYKYGDLENLNPEGGE